ncbi:hypothetical protein MLD38_016864 [Melastoma candidum]|uniref:Uncharacterized protein n=1 Tax=Melastoma candidum TaxID=119954 RepID=A0ACB9QQM7_9MYRT|nr:hypothetical protein MLD38_016864 [Melastoma candidum]
MAAKISAPCYLPCSSQLRKLPRSNASVRSPRFFMASTLHTRSRMHIFDLFLSFAFPSFGSMFSLSSGVLACFFIILS